MNNQITNPFNHPDAQPTGGDFDATSAERQNDLSTTLGRMAVENMLTKDPAVYDILKDNANPDMAAKISEAQEALRHAEGIAMATSILESQCDRDDIKRIIETIDYFRADTSGRKQSLVISEEDTGASMRFGRDTTHVRVGGTAPTTFPTDLLKETLNEWIAQTETDNQDAVPAQTVSEYGTQKATEVAEPAAFLNNQLRYSAIDDINKNKQL